MLRTIAILVIVGALVWGATVLALDALGYTDEVTRVEHGCAVTRTRDVFGNTLHESRICPR